MVETWWKQVFGMDMETDFTIRESLRKEEKAGRKTPFFSRISVLGYLID